LPVPAPAVQPAGSDVRLQHALPAALVDPRTARERACRARPRARAWRESSRGRARPRDGLGDPAMDAPVADRMHRGNYRRGLAPAARSRAPRPTVARDFRNSRAVHAAPRSARLAPRAFSRLAAVRPRLRVSRRTLRSWLGTDRALRPCARVALPRC